MPLYDDGPGTFADAPTLCSSDGKGNPVAIAVPYNCADEVFVLHSTKDGYPEWQAGVTGSIPVRSTWHARTPSATRALAGSCVSSGSHRGARSGAGVFTTRELAEWHIKKRLEHMKARLEER